MENPDDQSTPTPEPAIVRPSKLPADELASLAADYGIDPTRHRRRADLVAALAQRRRLIATLDRAAMLEVVRWGRRPVPADADRERLALEIARVRRWQYDELSQEGLRVLAALRGVQLAGDESPRWLVRRLRRGDGLAARLNRKRRAAVAVLAAKVVGEDESVDADDRRYAFLPSDSTQAAGKAPCPPGQSVQETLRRRIEERGLFGGLADRVRQSADSYVNQKLDEIEARIDRKLEEIDLRLAEWRDKEVANRLRILKITLWASVIVSIVSLAYAYLRQVVF
jgi:hypothetical protein